MVKLLNVSYRYNGSTAVEGISFEVEPGEFTLLVGRTGAGKTTLFRLISMEIVPNSGEIILERFRSGEIKSRNLPQWRRRIGIVFQDFKLLKDRSILENVRLAASCESNLPGSSKSRAFKALTKVGLSHKVHSFPNELSAGEQQRAAVARALVNEPFVLLADEPVSNLDGETAKDTVDLLWRINQSGTAVMVATHQPERFESCRPKVIRLEKGRLIER